MTLQSRFSHGVRSALLATSVLAMAVALPLQAEAAPRRVISLNLCTDELLLRLADRANVASVTWMARDPDASNVADIAAKVPVNHGLAEQIIPSDPDLVLAGQYTTRTAVNMLRETGFHVVEFGIPRDLADVRAEIRQMAGLIGEPARGEAMIAAMDLRLTQIGTSAETRRPTAVVFNPNGFTVGKGTLVDDIITRAGLDNIAARIDLGNYSQLSLETLVTSGVDVLILNEGRDGPPSLATEILRHPVLSKLGSSTRVVVLPSRLWTCGGPEVVEAIARLREVSDAVRSSRARP